MHDRPIPGLFIIGKIMRLKAFFKSFALSAFAVAFVSCSDDDEGFSYTTGEMNSPLADTIVVNDNAVMELQTDLDPSDKLVVKSNDTGAEIYLDWGYAYEGMDEDGNMLADKTRSYAKVVFDDKWECGKWKVYAEKASSYGRADCIVETSKYVYIFEFKLDGSAEDAVRQIDGQGYAGPYAADSRKLIRIGASFSSQTGTVSDWIIA